MIRYMLLVGIICLPLVALSQSNSTTDQTNLSEEVQFLFKDVKSKLTAPEKNLIFKELEISLSDDRQKWISYEFPVYIQVYPTDMNQDGLEEVFVAMSSSALFGEMMGGNQARIYMKSQTGPYKLSATIDGSIDVLPVANLGYPDLLAGGPGFEFPVYRWNGSTYEYNRVIEDGDYDKNNPVDIAEYSKRYSATLTDQGGMADDSPKLDQGDGATQKSTAASKDTWWTRMKKRLAGQ